MNVRLRRAQHRPAVPWFLAGYAGVAGFFVLEAKTRERGTASSLSASDDDRGTTRTIVAAYAAATLLATGLRRVRSGRLPRDAGAAGLATEATGLALRAWSMRTLGRSYSRTLRTDEEQQVIDTGPYRLVRHPGYLGSLLIWTGFALTSRSVPVVALVEVLLGRVYRGRIAGRGGAAPPRSSRLRRLLRPNETADPVRVVTRDRSRPAGDAPGLPRPTAPDYIRVMTAAIPG